MKPLKTLVINFQLFLKQIMAFKDKKLKNEILKIINIPCLQEKIKNNKRDKIKGSIFFKIRIHDKYRILYRIVNSIIYIFYFGNRDRIYKKYQRKEFNIEKINWIHINN